MPWSEDLWPGGRVWLDEFEQKTFVIRKQINGRRYEVSTRASTLRGAMAQLARFEANPEGYLPGGPGGSPVRLTDAMLSDYLAWCKDEKENTAEWRRKKRVYLRWWMTKIGSRDLRYVSKADHLLPALTGVKARAHRIAALKGFYKWLRTVRHLATTQQDPTLDMAVPQAKPAQWKASKVITEGDEAKILEELDRAAALDERSRSWGDLARLVSRLGCHITEVHRFARDGVLEKYHGGTVIVLPATKAGGSLRLDVSEQTAEIARRVRKAGSFSVSRFRKAIREAKAATGVKNYSPGWLRHTRATRAVEAGADIAQVAAYLGHRSPRTTKRFYSAMAAVPRPKGM